tara:strand:+ start:182 stop:550 length:369 start_codon:yes stop_codon:yes gene_type:complete
MSTINVSNITDGTTTVGTSYVVNGSAKAWAANVLDAATSQDTLNVSSITDTGSGDNRINLSNSMAYSNYAVVSMCSAIGNNTNPRNISLFDAPAASYRVYCTTPSGGGSSSGSHTSVFGDLA